MVISGRSPYGFVDKTGRIAINPQFDEAWDFVNGLAKVKLGGFGYVNAAGKYVYNPSE
jgi:hypothetical protein